MEIPADSLQGKVGLVTGGGSGIGQAVARTWAEAGARVAVLGRTREDLEATTGEIQRKGGEALVLTGDVSVPASISEALCQLTTTWGRLDILFANAGINGLWAPIDELSVEEWKKTLAINLTGTFITVKECVPLLKKRGGSIIITSSVNGTRMFSNTGASAYATSKAGQVAFARMMALELARFQIRVNTICPGAIETSIDENTKRSNLKGIRPPVNFPEGKIPLTGGKPGSSNQVAEVVWFLASDGASHITGTEIFIDGGQSLFQG